MVVRLTGQEQIKQQGMSGRFPGEPIFKPLLFLRLLVMNSRFAADCLPMGSAFLAFLTRSRTGRTPTRDFRLYQSYPFKQCPV
jgi:hypothetical protein